MLLRKLIFIKHNIFTNLLILLSALILLVACNSNLEQENKDLLIENEDLKLNLLKALEHAKHAENIHEVHVNLSRIGDGKRKVNELLKRDDGKSSTSKASIIMEIQLINSLQKIIESKLKRFNIDSSDETKNSQDIAKVVAELKVFRRFNIDAMEIIHERLIGLDYEKESLTASLDSVTFMNEINSGVLDLQEADLETAYYVKGDFKTLAGHNVIEKKGGVAGFGKVAVIRKDFDKSNFTKINLNLIYEIELSTVKAELLSTHPADSYKIIDKGGKSVILISNIKQFWEASRYLIVLEKR